MDTDVRVTNLRANEVLRPGVPNRDAVGEMGSCVVEGARPRFALIGEQDTYEERITAHGTQTYISLISTHMGKVGFLLCYGSTQAVEWRWRVHGFDIPWQWTDQQELRQKIPVREFDKEQVGVSGGKWEYLEEDQLGIEIRFQSDGHLFLELHRFPLTRQKLADGREFWKIGLEIMPPITHRLLSDACGDRVAARTRANGLNHNTATAVAAEVGSEVRTRVLTEWDRRHAPRSRSWGFPLFSPRWALATALVLGVVLLGGAGTVVAAQDAVPGANLYSVKQLEEQTRLWFARSPEVKVATYSELVRERADEIRELAAKGDSAHTFVAVALLEQHISDVSQLVDETRKGQENLPAAFEPDLLETIDQALVVQGPTASGLGNALELAPDDAYPCLRHSLKAIQSAR
ncbi:MAG: DUF5667 domain-containing protein, partial [Dehalococcoidia bacterium]